MKYYTVQCCPFCKGENITNITLKNAPLQKEKFYCLDCKIITPSYRLGEKRKVQYQIKLSINPYRRKRKKITTEKPAPRDRWLQYLFEQIEKNFK